MHWYDKGHTSLEPVVDLDLAENVQRYRVYRPPEIEDVLEKLEAFMKLEGYPSKDVFAVALAAHEVTTNVFRHGLGDVGSKGIVISYLVTAEEVVVRIHDEGSKFDPDKMADPHLQKNLERPAGLGLILLRAYSTWVRFDPPGNRVTFARRRSNVV